jgi:hypothetical protein
MSGLRKSSVANSRPLYCKMRANFASSGFMRLDSHFSSVETDLRRSKLTPLFSLGRRKLIPSLEHVTASEPTVTPISAAISSRPVPRSTRFLICWIRSGVNFNGLPLGMGLLTVPSDNALRAELCIVNPRAPRRTTPICYGRQPRQNPPYQRASHRLNRGGFVLRWHPGAEEFYSQISPIAFHVWVP